jgi:glycosyltransferase involved in cell wall biosynthesis
VHAFVVIPAYEPSERLVTLAKEFYESGCAVVIVDDGSRVDKKPYFDGAAKYAEVLVHQQNRGKGAAIKTALSRIMELAPKRPEIGTVVVVDCDGQHLPSDAMRVAAEAEAYPGSLVLGVRTVGSDMPARSRFGNSVTRVVFRVLSGVYVFDTQTGLRAFQSDRGDFMLNIPGERYEYEMNVLLTCARDKVNIREIDIETIYIDNNASSHFNTLRDSARIYKAILNFRKGVK